MHSEDAVLTAAAAGNGDGTPPAPQDLRVCIARPGRDIYSETFIRAHLERMPARVIGLYGDLLPIFTDAGEPLLPAIQRWLDRRVAAFRSVPEELVHVTVARAYPPGIRARWLARYLRRRRVAVVLAEFGPTGAAMREVCRRAGIPLVVHFHGQDAYAAEPLRRHAELYPRLFADAAAIVVVSRHMERQLLRLGAPRDRLVYNPYGVDPLVFNGADPAAAPPRFAAVGRFIEKKAPHLTILAFKAVVERFPDASLVMVGDGPLLEASRQLAGALDLAANVEFPGVLPPADVAALLRGARAFVQHSLRPADGDSEGMPLAVLEAAACGLPVVATRHGGIPDVVREGETGILVDEGDVAAMEDAMVELAASPARAAALGAAGRVRVVENFSIERSIAGLVKILEAAAARAPIGAGRAAAGATAAAGAERAPGPRSQAPTFSAGKAVGQ